MSFFLRFYLFIYLFLERGEGREKVWEKNINVWLPLTLSPTRDLACNPGMCPNGNRTSNPLVHRLALNPATPAGTLLLLLRTQIPSCQAPPIWPHLTLVTSLKAPFPNTVAFAVRDPTYEFWRQGDTIQSIILTTKKEGRYILLILEMKDRSFTTNPMDIKG